MRIRIAFVAAVATVALCAVGVPAAGAATPSLPLVHAVGVAKKSGKKFNATYHIQRFQVATVHGKRGVYAVGTLTGKLKNHQFSLSNVMMPAKLTSSPASATGVAKDARQAAPCSVLHLVLGPINLNLLGLTVSLGGGTVPVGGPATQPITIDIAAIPGGGLLGNLLNGLVCNSGLSGALGGLTGGQLSGLLNGLLGILSGLGL